MQPLNRETAGVSVQRPIKVLQFGTGNFLRGFVDWAIDILNERTDFNGDVQIVQPHGKVPAEALNAQGGLYHVLIRGIQNGKVIEENRLITSVRGAVNPFLEYDRYLELSNNPDLRLVISNTTEAGIYFDPNDSHDVGVPASFPGKLTALLYRRFHHFEGENDKGLVIIPCELIENNGGKLKEVILEYARLWSLGDEFIRWIENNNAFCNTLVDRIVPGFPFENAREIQESLGFKDEMMVMAEPFHFWAIEGPDSLEDIFSVEKTDLNIVMVKDLNPYRQRKVRILNGAHTAMVPLAYQNGMRTVKEAVENDDFGSFLTHTINNEIIPTLDLPREELGKFAHDVLERFKNPFIKHQLADIALNSIAKFKVRVLPSLLDYQKRQDKLPENLILSFAALIVFYKGDYGGKTIPLRDADEVLEFFREIWKTQEISTLVRKVLSNRSLWDQDLNQINGLDRLITEKIELLLKQEFQTGKDNLSLLSEILNLDNQSR